MYACFFFSLQDIQDVDLPTFGVAGTVLWLECTAVEKIQEVNIVLLLVLVVLLDNGSLLVLHDFFDVLLIHHVKDVDLTTFGVVCGVLWLPGAPVEQVEEVNTAVDSVAVVVVSAWDCHVVN